MTWIVWTVGGVLALLWTGAAALLGQLLAWGSGLMQRAGGAQVELPQAITDTPAWLAPWIDPATLEAWRAAAVQAWHAVQALLPIAGTATGWLGPVVWVVWGLGMLLILAGAGGAHWLIGRRWGAPPHAA